MRQIAALVTIMILIFQGVSSLALASVSQEEINLTPKHPIIGKPRPKHGMMHGHKLKHQQHKMQSFKTGKGKMQHFRSKKGKMHRFRGGRGQYCSECFKQQIREMKIEDKSYNLPYNLGLACLPKPPAVIKKFAICHEYILTTINMPKQEYYAPLEKPPKA